MNLRDWPTFKNELTCMAETTDSVSLRKDSVSRLESLGSDRSLVRIEDRDLGTLGSRRRVLC